MRRRQRPRSPPRAMFELVFAYGVGARTVLDTRRGTFTKDMVTASPITIAMELGLGDMARISQKMEEIGFFSYPAVFTVLAAAGGGGVTPFATDRFAVTTGAGGKVVEWADEVPSDDERTRGLRGLACGRPQHNGPRRRDCGLCARPVVFLARGSAAPLPQARERRR